MLIQTAAIQRPDEWLVVDLRASTHSEEDVALIRDLLQNAVHLAEIELVLSRHREGIMHSLGGQCEDREPFIETMLKKIITETAEVSEASEASDTTF